MDLNSLSIVEKKQLVQKVYIKYPRQKNIIEKIKEAYESSADLSESHCICIIGGTGMGKTTIFEEFINKYPSVADENGKKVEIITATTPVPATILALVCELLEALGAPVPAGSAPKLTIKLRGLIKRCGVKLIILDEFQHFIDRDNLKVRQSVSDWLKNLIQKTGVSIILVGLPESVAVLKANEQLERRFSSVIELEPFKWDSEKNINEFQSFLYLLDNNLPFEEKADLAEFEMAARIFYATNGIIGYVMKLIRTSAKLTLDLREPRITNEILSKVYDEDISFAFSEKVNPFKDDITFSKLNSLIEDEKNKNVRKNIPNALNRRSKKKAKRINQ